MTTGELTSMIIYAVQILSSLMMLSMVFVMITMASESAHRILEVIQEESTLKAPRTASPKWQTAPSTLTM